MRRLILPLLVLLAQGSKVAGQSVLDRSPNVQGTWTLPRGNAAFVFAHRFELHEGGDELLNIPTLTLALGLPLGLTAGLDYSSNSEIVTRQGGNETQFWLKRALGVGERTALAGLVGYNTAAESVDAALDVRHEWGRLGVYGEGRAFSDLFGMGSAGASATVGAAVRLTPYLALSGDAGRVITEDSFPTVWSAAVAVAIPGSPHTFSLQATNSGSITLHGVSRERPKSFSSTRYGFVFTVPLGTGARWARIFRPSPPRDRGSAPAAASVRGEEPVQVELRQVAFTPAEVRVRAGQSVQWTNHDPMVHSVVADDRSWESSLLQEGDRFSRRFDQPGRYTYHCAPHPQMTAVVIVEPG